MAALSTYDRELQQCVDEGVIIIDQSHRSNLIPAAAQEYYGIKCVFIDELAFPSDAERLWALTHEVAHHKKAGLYDESTPEMEKARIEYRADKETVEKRVNFTNYCNVILSGCFTAEEQADKWNIPERHVPTVHEIYNRTRWEDVQVLWVQVRDKFNLEG